MNDKPSGTIFWISGPVLRATIDSNLAMAEQVRVGYAHLAAEVIAVTQSVATIQVYEDTSGLHIGEPVYGMGYPLSVTLGPGLLGNVFDGVQRPLDVLAKEEGIFIQKGEEIPPLNLEKKWTFTPSLKAGVEVVGGDVLGTVPETPAIDHKVLVPPKLSGTLTSIVNKGDYSIDEQIAELKDSKGIIHKLTMTQRWPVRTERPVFQRLDPIVPLITGQRVIDIFFPIAMGGTAAIPGGFGTGKTVTLHSLAKYSNADVIIYVGCGERGNEMTQVLEDFPKLIDPRTGRPLMERTVLVANTSNMPVAARAASIYTGLTIAEYYRDQGYDTALIADSTSRWAQALREIAGRLQEMPAEEGYPAYLPARLAAFYERASRVTTHAGKNGSATVIGAVSPAGGDFSEPVTRHTKRFTRCFWALDEKLAHERHYPAINWEESYSLYLKQLAGWWHKNVTQDWETLRARALELLHEESQLQQIVQLIGPNALAGKQQWVLKITQLLRDGYLEQNAFNKIDAFCSPQKQIALLEFFIWLHDRGEDLLKAGVQFEDIMKQIDLPDLIRLREQVPNDHPEQIDDLKQTLAKKLNTLSDSIGAKKS
jgi:V/A-type H+/Na+-transporting ATPase subunit A